MTGDGPEPARAGPDGGTTQMQAAQMQAAVIIPHFNDTARLETCLAALEPQVAGRAVEVIVADNASSQDLGPVRARFPWAVFCSEPDPGAAAARNRGVAASTAPRLFFTDADCVPAPDWIETALALDGAGDLIGGAVEMFDETPPPRSGAEAFETVFAFPQRRYVEERKFSVTANLLTTRAVFDDVGPFDGSRVEDQDWCWRARDRGYGIVYRAGLRVAHPTRQDWPALVRKWRRANAELYFSNGTGPLRRLLWGLRGLAVLASVPVAAPRVLADRRLSGLEKRRALATLLRIRALRAGWMLRDMLFGAAPINRPPQAAGAARGA